VETASVGSGSVPGVSGVVGSATGVLVAVAAGAVGFVSVGVGADVGAESAGAPQPVKRNVPRLSNNSFFSDFFMLLPLKKYVGFGVRRLVQANTLKLYHRDREKPMLLNTENL
jgi:hypothetical protein